MVTAFGVSTLFLGSYVTYRYQAGSRAFTGAGWIRVPYFVILISHTIPTVAIVPLVLTTRYPGLTAQFARHVSIAPVDVPAAALRVGHGGGGVLDALPWVEAR